MNTMKCIFGIGTALMLTCGVGIAQDIHFSQFSASPSTLNPATTGNFNGQFRVVANYKDQWRNIAKPYSTFSASFDMPFMQDKITDGALAAGISFYSDKAGDLNFSTNMLNVSIAANKSVDKKNNFSLGLQGGFGQRGISGDVSDQQWGNQYDADGGYNSNNANGENATMQNFFYGDFSAGFLWQHKTEKAEHHAGLSLFHINSPKQSFYKESEKLYAKLTFHAGSKIDIAKKNFSLIPQYLFLMQGPQFENNAGMLVKYVLQQGSIYTGEKLETAVYLGGWYRIGDAAIINARVDYMDFSVGISYDFNLSTLKVVSDGRGGIEISVSYIKSLRSIRKTRRSLM